MKDSYLSPAKNIHGAVLRCPTVHPDIERKRKQAHLIKPEYKGVSPSFRALFEPETLTGPEISPELYPDVKTDADFAASFLAQTRHFLKR